MWRVTRADILRVTSRLVAVLTGFRAGQLLSVFLVCQLTGLLGVVTGYAVFFLFIEEAEHPRMFLAALLVAAVLSTTFEWLRGVIDHNEKWSLSKIIVTMSVLAVAEFYVMASEKAVNLADNTETFIAAAGIIMGGSSASATHSWWDLGFLAGLWMFVGAVLAGWLSSGIDAPSRRLSERIEVSAARGLVAGALIAPLALVVYTVVVNFGRGVYTSFHSPDTWRHNQQQIDKYIWKFLDLPIPAAFFLSIMGLLALGLSLAIMGPVMSFLARLRPRRKRYLGFFLFVVISVVLVALCLAFLVSFAIVVIILFFLELMVTFVAPLLPNLHQLLFMAASAALVWSIPGAVLGGLVPFLNRPSKNSGYWAGIAFAAATFLLVLTLARFEQRWWLLVLIASLVLLGVFGVLRARNASTALVGVERFFPQMALSVATLVGTLTFGAQEVASFAGVYQRLHAITHPPDRLPRVLTPEERKRSEDIRRLTANMLKPLPTFSDLGSGGILKFQSLLAEADAAHAIAVKEWNEREASIRQELEKLTEEPFHGRMETLSELQAEVQLRDKESETQLAELKIAAARIERIQGPSFLPLPYSVRQEGGRTFIQPREQKDVRKELDELNASVRNYRDEVLADFDRHKKKVQMLRKNLQRFSDEVLAPKEREPIRWFEVAVAASVGFWTTVGLLAGWSIWNHRADNDENLGGASG